MKLVYYGVGGLIIHKAVVNNWVFISKPATNVHFTFGPVHFVHKIITPMKKILLFTAFVVLTVSQSFAQLSTRENYDVNLRLGTRPQAGDACLQFVLPLFSDSLSAFLYSGNSLFANDFLTYKYYMTDDVVLRTGLRWSVESGKFSGTAADSTDINPIPETELQTVEQKFTSRDFSIAAGLEKHFSNSNIFDVYGGAEIMIGLGKDKSRNDRDYFNGDKQYMTSTTNTRVLGFGLVTGFNIFVAELPLSIGLEYGLTGKWLFGGKTKVEVDEDINGTSVSGEYFTQEEDAFGNQDFNSLGESRQYSDLSRRTFNMNTNHNVRLSVNIYFSTLSNPSASR